MINWDICDTLDEPQRIVEVKNVVGTPTMVENNVNKYLKQGYYLGSELLPWAEPSTNIQLFVQQVVLYEGEDDGNTTIRCES